MNQIFIKWAVIITLVLALILIPLVACGDDDDGETDETTTTQPTSTQASPTATTQPQEDVVIKLGYLTDLTGPAAASMANVNTALDNIVQYYNEENLIPGVELDVITYDTQWDPSRDIPGYQWVLQEGADVVISIPTSSAITLKPFAVKDEEVVLSASASPAIADPPGRVFALGNSYTEYAYTMLSWIAENDWDYQTNGPAKIGLAMWEDPSFHEFASAMEEYADAHPEQFDVAAIHLVPFTTMTWGPEVDSLKNCDYVVPNSFAMTFIKEFRDFGAQGKLIFLDGHLNYMGMLSDAGLLNKIDDTICIKNPIGWWGEDEELVQLTEEILRRYNSSSADGIMALGSSYLAIGTWFEVLGIIEDAVESVGTENVDAEAIYEAAKSFEFTTAAGDSYYSFGETKRIAVDYCRIYHIDGASGDLIPYSPDPVPVVRTP